MNRGVVLFDVKRMGDLSPDEQVWGPETWEVGLYHDEAQGYHVATTLLPGSIVIAQTHPDDQAAIAAVRAELDRLGYEVLKQHGFRGGA